jgi:hypothetical protein
MGVNLVKFGFLFIWKVRAAMKLGNQSLTILLFGLCLSPFAIASGHEYRASTLSAVHLKLELQLERVDGRVTKLAGEANQKTLRELAEASVVADSCAGMPLDDEPFKAQLNFLTLKDGRTGQETNSDYQNRMRTYFGVYIGLLEAESIERGSDFCAAAQEDIRKKGPLSRWIKRGPN